MDRPQSLERGAAFMVGSALLFAGMGAAVKLASASLPNTMVVFFRNALGLVALVPWLVRLRRQGLGTTHLREHAIRGLAGLAAMYCFFLAIAQMKLADAVLLNYSLPLFLPLVEKVWLGEEMPRRFWGPLGLGFAGVLFVLKPGLGVFQPVALVGLAAAVFGAVAQVGVRRLTRTEPVTRIVFYFGLVGTAVSAVPLAWTWRSPEPALWLVLAAMGLLATVGQLFLTRAYAHAPAAQVGPFVYSAVVFAALFDGFLWGRWPDRLTLAGAVLVSTAGALALRRKPTMPPIETP
jgi:drug/metabolite transporter (DMT)-like permease